MLTALPLKTWKLVKSESNRSRHPRNLFLWGPTFDAEAVSGRAGQQRGFIQIEYLSMHCLGSQDVMTFRFWWSMFLKPKFEGRRLEGYCDHITKRKLCFGHLRLIKTDRSWVFELNTSVTNASLLPETKQWRHQNRDHRIKERRGT